MDALFREGGGADLLTPSPIHLPGEGIRCCSRKEMTFINRIDEQNTKWRPQAPPPRAPPTPPLMAPPTLSLIPRPLVPPPLRGGARSLLSLLQMWPPGFNIIPVILGALLSIHPARLNPSHQDTRHGTEVDLWLIVVYSQCPGGNGRQESRFHLWRADVDLPLRLCHRKGLAGITLALTTSL